MISLILGIILPEGLAATLLDPLLAFVGLTGGSPPPPITPRPVEPEGPFKLKLNEASSRSEALRAGRARGEEGQELEGVRRKGGERSREVELRSSSVGRREGER
jgi:hypothetical protein